MRFLLLARNGPPTMSTVRSLSGGKQTCGGRPISVAIDPGCVKTRTSRECAELFSQLPSSDRRCQCNWFLHRRNREGSSIRKSSVGVFTRPGPTRDTRSLLLRCSSSHVLKNRTIDHLWTSMRFDQSTSQGSKVSMKANNPETFEELSLRHRDIRRPTLASPRMS
jgi:hypothetical protein